jgi:hypothetical protein
MKFKIEESKFDVYSKKSKWFKLIVLCDDVGFFEQTFNVFASIGGNVSREVLFTCILSAEFIQPRVYFDRHELVFYVNHCDREVEQHDEGLFVCLSPPPTDSSLTLLFLLQRN